VLAGIGARGFAGSGLHLNPEQAVHDLSPWARMSGRLTDEAFSEMPTVRETIASIVHPAAPGEPEVKVRCQACQALNDEHDKFCGQCGKQV
jgi:hypothetical protein